MFCTFMGSSFVMVFAILALLAVFASAEEGGSRNDGKMLRQLATIPIITVTTPSGNDLIFTGMPTSIKAGTYKIKYINKSSIPHNFKIRGNTSEGLQKTPVCAKCTRTITVTFEREINGKLSPKRKYVCEPHSSVMSGFVTVTA